MNIPGVNVLGLAMTAIRAQPVVIFRFTENVGQPNGADLPMYAAGVPALGSVQPVSSRTKHELGLEWNSTYVSLFTSAALKTVERDGAGDVFVYAGKYYHAQARTDWTGQDGWNEILAVEIPALAAGQVQP